MVTLGIQYGCTSSTWRQRRQSSRRPAPPPLPPPDPMGPAGPAGPPGPLPAGAALLAQMVTAMQAAAAGITSPRPRRSSTTPTWSENIPPYF